MPVARILSRAELALDAPLVQVEVHLGRGLPAFSIVGLPAPVVRESRERVRSALLNSGYDFPARRITVNLAPVELSKRGARFDLPIALGLLIASGQLRVRFKGPFECYGELGLDGELRGVGGLFLAAVHALQARHTLIVPRSNLEEIQLSGLRDVHGVEHLRSAAALIAATSAAAQAPTASATAAAAELVDAASGEDGGLALAGIVGQSRAKRALVIAATGGHSLLFVGVPGGGKSLLAASLPALLPPLTRTEALELARVTSLAGQLLDARRWRRRPFRSPHHTASVRSMVGGGVPIRPGEISLAHGGVLFLDELPEFSRDVLEALREPLETGHITLSRAAQLATLPARFQLIAAMNPCPCGYLGDHRHDCRCSPAVIARYRQRISGPLLDRIDLRVEVPPLDSDELTRVAGIEPGHRAGSTCATLGEEEHALIRHLHAVRAERIERSGQACAALSRMDLQRVSPLTRDAAALLQRSCQRLAISARALQRVLAVSRTIADLAGSSDIEREHLAEAIQLRRPLAGSAEQSERERSRADQWPTSESM
jgi:magnesium chelatase family protein